MKKIFEIIKEHFILLLGTGLFTYSLFSFNSDKYCNDTGGIKLPAIGSKECINPATFYYYDNLTLVLLILGTILIVIGLLKIWKS